LSGGGRGGWTSRQVGQCRTTSGKFDEGQGDLGAGGNYFEGGRCWQGLCACRKGTRTASLTRIVLAARDRSESDWAGCEGDKGQSGRVTGRDGKKEDRMRHREASVGASLRRSLRGWFP